MNRRQRIFAGVVIALLLLSGGTTLWMATCGLAGCPSAEQLRGFRPSEGSRVLDRNGAPLGRLAYVRRINVPLERVPRHVRAAFIAAEDRRFYYHGGIDWRSAGTRAGAELPLARRARGLQHHHHAGGAERLPPPSRRRSARSAASSSRSSWPAGSSARCRSSGSSSSTSTSSTSATAPTASRRRAATCSARACARLTVGEAALLAGLARGPSIYSPRRHPDRARGRRGVVLAQMASEGYLDAGRVERAGERAAQARGLGLEAAPRSVAGARSGARGGGFDPGRRRRDRGRRRRPHHARCGRAARRGARGERSGGGDRAGRRCRVSSRGARAPGRAGRGGSRAPGRSAPSSAAAATCSAGSTARSARGASRARRSSPSSTPRRSRTATRPPAWWTTRRSRSPTARGCGARSTSAASTPARSPCAARSWRRPMPPPYG